MSFRAIHGIPALVAIAAIAASAQPPVGISKVTAEPSHLSCPSGPKNTTLTAQVYFDDGNPDLKNQSVLISLSIYSAKPSKNRLWIIDKTQTVFLDRSPGLAKFQVACDSFTEPGQVVLFAAVSKAPKGVDASAGTFAESGRVTVQIDQPER
jgi:hypothetical protein